MKFLRRYNCPGLILLGAVLVFLTDSSSVAAQKAPPIVRLRFTVEASDFVQNFDPPSSRKEFEQEITAELVPKLWERFSYLRWVSAFDSVPEPVAADLTIALKDQRPARPTDITLVYSAFVGENQVFFDRNLEEKLYRKSDQQPTNDHSRLREDLLAKLGQQLNNDGFLLLLQDKFLRGVPLVSEIDVRGLDQRVILPITYELLGPPSESSVLRVEFVAQRPGEQQKEGSLSLSPTARFLGDPMGTVECSVTRFNFAPFNESTWHPEIPAVLGVKIGSVRVFMERFLKKVNPGTLGGTVTDPGGNP